VATSLRASPCPSPYTGLPGQAAHTALARDGGSCNNGRRGTVAGLPFTVPAYVYTCRPPSGGAAVKQKIHALPPCCHPTYCLPFSPCTWHFLVTPTLPPPPACLPPLLASRWTLSPSSVPLFTPLCGTHYLADANTTTLRYLTLLAAYTLSYLATCHRTCAQPSLSVPTSLSRWRIPHVLQRPLPCYAFLHAPPCYTAPRCLYYTAPRHTHHNSRISTSLLCASFFAPPLRALPTLPDSPAMPAAATPCAYLPCPLPYLPPAAPGVGRFA